MKYTNYIKSLFYSTVFVAAGIGFTGCDNAKYDALDTHVYIEEALSSSSAKVNIKTNGESFAALNIHASNLTSQDSHFQLIMDDEVLKEYNAINGTSYMPLPQGQYVLPEDIFIKAGEYNAPELSIALKPFSDEMMKSGESYALPLRLVSKDSKYPVMNNTGSFVILAESVIKFSAPMFEGGADLFSPTFINKPETYAQYTIEVRFQVSNTANRNRAVFSTSDNQGRSILLRFEDPQSFDSENQWEAHSLVQIQLHNGYVNPSNNFKSNKWQHLAVTFDGMKYRIYINGVESGTLDNSDACKTFASVNWFTDGDGNQGGWWRGCKVLVSEARLWSVVRSSAQIQNSMTQVSPKSSGLEAYWKMNEGEGNEFKDVTGNGHVLTTKKTPVWINGILSTDESTKWE